MKAGKKVNGADSGGPRRNPPKIDWDACLLLPCSLPWLRALLKGEGPFLRRAHLGAQQQV